MNFSNGIIKDIIEGNNTIIHYCDSRNGSSGGPIINSVNFNVVGIHKGGVNSKENFNLGTFLKYPIKKYFENLKYKKENKEILNIKNRSEIQKNESNYIEKNNKKQKPKEEKKKLNISLPVNIIEECYLNVILIGKTCSGKSIFLIEYITNEIWKNSMTTIGFDKLLKTLNLENKEIHLCIHDTPGHNRFINSIKKSLFGNKRIDGIIFFFDLAYEDSSEYLIHFLNFFEEFELEKGYEIIKVLVGNKFDLIEEAYELVDQINKNHALKLYDFESFKKHASDFIVNAV